MQGTRVVILLLLGAVLHLVDVEAARLLAGHGDPSDYNYSHAGARGELPWCTTQKLKQAHSASIIYLRMDCLQDAITVMGMRAAP
jgi:hypothetical protein